MRADTAWNDGSAKPPPWEMPKKRLTAVPWNGDPKIPKAVRSQKYIDCMHVNTSLMDICDTAKYINERVATA